LLDSIPEEIHVLSVEDDSEREAFVRLSCIVALCANLSFPALLLGSAAIVGWIQGATMQVNWL
jgi:hypothetical protein